MEYGNDIHIPNPCPFCKSTVVDVIIHRTRGATCHFNAQARCRRCGARGPIVNSPDTDWRCSLSDLGEESMRKEAIEKWNWCGMEDDAATDGLPLFGTAMNGKKN